MDSFQLTLVTATLLCSLVAGFLFAFAVVAMPGLGTLGNREFLQGFQVIDRVIQNNQPLFMLVWIGSVVALVASGALGFFQIQGTDRILLIAAVGIYLFGVQLPTIAINVPLNNELQAIDLKSADATTLTEARNRFEARWNQSNVLRTILAVLTSGLLIVLVLRL